MSAVSMKNSAEFVGPHFWVPPRASLASRRPPLRSTASFRGSFVNDTAWREIVYESTLERDLAHILLVHPQVSEIHDQPPPISYIDDCHKKREHTFDFLAVRHDRIRIAIAVRPTAKVQSSGIARILTLVREQAPKNFADHYELRTEHHITLDRAFNARLIIRARRMRDESDVVALKEIAGTLRGSAVIDKLLDHFRNDGRGFIAAISLIDDGFLQHTGSGRISRLSTVRPTRTED